VRVLEERLDLVKKARKQRVDTEARKAAEKKKAMLKANKKTKAKIEIGSNLQVDEPDRLPTDED
jgi:hypothetical protein